MTLIELARGGLWPVLIILAALAWSRAGTPNDARPDAGMMDAVPDGGVAASQGSTR